jgi:phenylacetate-CoA ligase
MNRRAFWKRDKLLSFQNRRIAEIVKYAYENSRFYRKKFMAAGIYPDQIKTAADLNRVPVVSKQELKANIDDVIPRKYDRSRLLVQRTSGSTGQPLHVYLTGAENEYRKAKHLRAQMALGQKPWDKWAVVTSPLHFAETSRLQRQLRLFGTFPISVFDDIETQVSKLESYRPDVIDGYSNSILLLAKELKKRGLGSVAPKFLVSGAELLDHPSREFVENVFGVPFYDQYACVEVERMAWQCRQKDDYHIDADSIVLQFLDKNGDEAAAGEEGEIICTSLFNYSMPIIRYALEDIGVPSEKAECECGRSFPMMKVMEGRKTSLLVFPSGRVFAPFAFMLAVWTFKGYDSIDMFRIIQRRKDLIVFRLKIKDSAVDHGLTETELVTHVRNVLGITEDEIKFEVEFVEDIPLDKSGKFRIVISELN